MSKGIALLLDGSSSDIYSNLCAIELAKRVSADIHALAMASGEASAEASEMMGLVSMRGRPSSDPMDSLRMAVRLGDRNGVKIYSYLVGSNIEEALIEFLMQKRVPCLITGAVNESVSKEKEKWLSRLRRRLNQNGKWYYGPFWTLVVRPWEDDVYDRLLEVMASYRQKFN
ncbi:MAG: hypothetical protein M0022_07040 [Desulfobacteraceae bacterium]|nr:hypothetical protein [Desulfobacteraceae bacterium]